MSTSKVYCFKHGGQGFQYDCHTCKRESSKFDKQLELNETILELTKENQRLRAELDKCRGVVR